MTYVRVQTRVVVAATTLLMGCVSTVSCPEGEGFAPLDGGGWATECTPISDAGPLDAMTDGGGDGGPCGMECTGDRSVCDSSSGACVECLVEGDCSGMTPLCDTDTHECVACLMNSDCTEESMPICDGGTCVGCSADADCMPMAGTPVCDEPSGRCVECTADTEATECGDFSCSRLTFTCTTTMRGLLDTCDACVADSDCAAGRRCIQHAFMGTDTGYFCFLDSAMGCGDTVLTRRPYSARTELDSIDGVRGTYCMPPTTTTCRGIMDTRSTTCSLDTDCGVTGLDDGYCPTAGTGAGLCSYRCTGGVECVDGLSCAGTPQHCRP